MFTNQTRNAPGNVEDVMRPQILEGAMEIDEVSEFKTPDYLTKYELIEILGMRTTQLRNNADPKVAIAPCEYYKLDPMDVARMELQEKKLQFMIRRFLPDGTHEDRRVDQLNLFAPSALKH